jgi:hypothetical protein
MRVDDLDQPRFTQAQVLRLVPDLTRKNLQNWGGRGLLDLDGADRPKHAKRLYSVIDVVSIAAANGLVEFGLGPSDALAIAAPLAGFVLDQHLPDFVQQFDDDVSLAGDGSPLRVCVYRKAVGYGMTLMGPPKGVLSYHTLEVEALVVEILCRMDRLLSGQEPLPPSHPTYPRDRVDQ